MTSPKPAAGPPSPSGVRRGGDRFQDLFVWGAALQVVRADSKYSQVEVEITGVGNLDDVVLRSKVGVGDVFGQVKWATNAAEQLTEENLLARAVRNGQRVGRSVLQKLYDSYGKVLGDGHPPKLRLITNRALDGAHPLLGHVDGRTQLLLPYAAQVGPDTDAARAVDAWALHVGAAREDLLAMLGSLEFHTGRTIPAERDHVRTLMGAAGLDDSDTALQHGLDIVAGWVVEGKRVVTATDVNAAVDERGLRRVDPSAILVIEAIDSDPHVDEATVALNWVDLYAGDQPRTRVQPRDAADWGRMDRELTEAAATLEAEGWKSILVRGAMRQALFFRVGTGLPAVRQHTLRYLQGSQLWSTDTPKAPVAALRVQRTKLNSGSDIAIAVGVAVDPTTAVAGYLRTQVIPVGDLVTIQPANGADDQAVASAGQAVTYAQQVRDLVRRELDDQPGTGRVHLFLAGPAGSPCCSGTDGTASERLLCTNT